MLALLCAVWGMTFPATRGALKVTDPVQFLALRFAIAVVCVPPLMLLLGRPLKFGYMPGRRRAWRLSLLVGALMFAGFALQTIGMKYTTASRSAFFTGLLVVLTPIAAALFRTSKMHLAGWLGVPVAFAGVYLMADPRGGGLNVGDWLTICCAIVFALQMVSLEYAAPIVGDSWLLAFIQMAVIALGAMIWAAIDGAPFHITAAGWGAAIYNGLFGGVLAVWMQTRYQPEVPAGHAALVFTLEPVFAGLFAWILLGEVWRTRGFAGAGLILAAMAAASIAMNRTTETQRAQRQMKNE